MAPPRTLQSTLPRRAALVAVSAAAVALCACRASAPPTPPSSFDAPPKKPAPIVGAPHRIAASRAEFACAIDPEGAVVCWGRGYGAEPRTITRPGSAAPLGPMKDIVASSWGRACGLTERAEVYCWYAKGDPFRVDVFPAERLSHASSTGCALLTDRGVQCWGLAHGSSASGAFRAASGELDAPRDLPIARIDIDDVIQLEASPRGFCALRGDRSTLCWDDQREGPPVRAPLPRADRIGFGGFRDPCAIASGAVTCLISDRNETIPIHGVTSAQAVWSDQEHSGLLLMATGEVLEISPRYRDDEGHAIARPWRSTVVDKVRGVEEEASFVELSTPGIWMEDCGCAVRTDGAVACWGPGRLVGGDPRDRYDELRLIPRVKVAVP